MLNKHFYPYIGNKKVSSIQQDDLQTLLSRFAGYSKDYAKFALMVIKQFFKYARKNNFTKSVPEEDLMLPKNLKKPNERALKHAIHAAREAVRGAYSTLYGRVYIIMPP